MAKKPQFDTRAAHEHFSAQCFNKAWDLMEKTDRTPEENAQMIQLNQASLYHWTQRDDCTKSNLSVGYWQASRIYSLLGQADNAREYGELSLMHSQGEPAFYRGYAYEALARAEALAGNKTKKNEYLTKAREQLSTIKDPEEKKILLGDLDSIE